MWFFAKSTFISTLAREHGRSVVLAVVVAAVDGEQIVNSTLWLAKQWAQLCEIIEEP